MVVACISNFPVRLIFKKWGRRSCRGEKVIKALVIKEKYISSPEIFERVLKDGKYIE